MQLTQLDVLKLIKFKTKNGLSELSRTQISNILKCSDSTARIYKAISDNPQLFEPFDRELILESVKLAKEKQKQQDNNRIERKAFREHARIENAVSEYGKELLYIAEQFGNELKKIKFPEIKTYTGNPVGVFHITDWHANELIDLPYNKFDFKVLSKRAHKMVCEAKKYFNAVGVKTVILASTGDLLNSDRRLDELLNQATNRSKATFLAAHIIKHVILDLRKDFNIYVTGVVGNESRVTKEMTYSNKGLSDNYDFVIMNHLKEMFSFANIDGVNFGDIDKVEQVVKISDQTWLLSHDLSKSLSKQKDIQSTIGRFYLAGNPVDYVLGGHVHSERITEYASRSSSICGSNSYNEVALNLIGRAGQSIFIVSGKNRTGIGLDLQDIEGYEGYPIIKELEAYNAKSLGKTKQHTKVMEIVI